MANRVYIPQQFMKDKNTTVQFSQKLEHYLKHMNNIKEYVDRASSDPQIDALATANPGFKQRLIDAQESFTELCEYVNEVSVILNDVK